VKKREMDRLWRGIFDSDARSRTTAIENAKKALEQDLAYLEEEERTAFREFHIEANEWGKTVSADEKPRVMHDDRQEAVSCLIGYIAGIVAEAWFSGFLTARSTDYSFTAGFLAGLMIAIIFTYFVKIPVSCISKTPDGSKQRSFRRLSIIATTSIALGILAVAPLFLARVFPDVAPFVNWGGLVSFVAFPFASAALYLMYKSKNWSFRIVKRVRDVLSEMKHTSYSLARLEGMLGLDRRANSRGVGSSTTQPVINRVLTSVNGEN